jgi:predicted MFS family arabinose efflux permease
VGGFVSHHFGWRTAFMSVGIPGVIFALVFFITVKEPQRGRWETAEEAAYKPTLGQTFKLLSSYRSFWYIALGTGFTAFVGYGSGNFAPSFLMRSHDLSVGQAGMVLAAFAGGGGMVGTFLGGYLVDRLGRRDKRWYVWLPAIAALLAVPISFPYLLLDNTYVSVGMLFVLSILINTYLGPCLAISHTLVPPAMRALASAILFFVLNLIGLGLGPLTAGILSDYLTGIYGTDGLRYAILIVGMMAIVAAWMFFLAGRHLQEDLDTKAATLHH